MAAKHGDRCNGSCCSDRGGKSEEMLGMREGGREREAGGGERMGENKGNGHGVGINCFFFLETTDALFHRKATEYTIARTLSPRSISPRKLQCVKNPESHSKTLILQCTFNS